MFLLVPVLPGSGCGVKENSMGGGVALLPTAVVVEKVDRRDVPIVMELAARTEAAATVEIRANVEGRLLEMTRKAHGHFPLLAAGLVLALGISIAPAHAQSNVQVAPNQFTSLTGFGDSYVDTGTAPGGAFRMIGWTGCPIGPSPGYPTCRFTGGTNFVDSLQSIYGLPDLTNFAIGGARTDVTNISGVPGAGFAQELANFAAGGMRFTDRDLIALSIGGNDTSLVTSANSIVQVNALATASAANAAAGVQQLVASGAHNIAWLSPGNSAYFPVPPNGHDGLPLTTAQRTAWAQTFFRQIQLLLSPAARSGVRIFLFDFETLQARIAANPDKYGFAGAGGCQASLGASGCFYWNGVHPGSAGMALIARYMANQMDAPLTVVSQGSITTGIAANFAASVLGRLDAYRTSRAIAISPATTIRPAALERRWSIYGGINYGSGGDERPFPAARYDRRAIGGNIGIESRVDPKLRLGGVFNYSALDVTLDVQNAHDRIKAYQFAGYGSFTDAHWHADALIAYGRHNHALDRQGVIDVIQAGTTASTFTAAGKAGYLVDLGLIHAGPIAGLGYTHAVIQAYTETGDSLITMAVDRQALDNLTGYAGLQLRFPFPLGRGLYSPFINVTAEHDFIGSGRTVTTTQVTTPLLPVLTPVPGHGRTYGTVAAGIAAIIAKNLSATVNMGTTVARDGRENVAVSAGIKLSF